MHHHHFSKSPAIMAELFGKMPQGNADYFVIRRLDMGGKKIELSTPPVSSHVHCFFYLESGEALLTIGSESYFFKPGECATIPAGQVFSVRYFDNCTGYMGGFSTGFIHTAGSNPLRAYSSFRRRGYHKVLFPQGYAEHIGQVFSRLRMEYEGNRNLNIIKVYLTALLTEIEGICGQYAGENGIQTEDNNICDKFIELVFDECNLEAAIKDYAGRMNISQDYLQKTIKRFTGRTPLSWIHEAVILKAKTLLAESGMTVAEVSLQVGVDDPAYFSRLFKKHTGYSPSDYKKSIKSNNWPE